MSKEYNGHRSHSAWNVSLWLNNDEGLYNLARACIRLASNRNEAAARFVRELADQGVTKTPDGTPYTKTSVKLAMVGL